MVRRGCIRPMVTKAIGRRSLMPSDTGVMPQKIHPKSGVGDERKPLNSKGFDVVKRVFLLTRIGAEPLINAVPRSMLSFLRTPYSRGSSHVEVFTAFQV
jgi:hypothetical protein